MATYGRGGAGNIVDAKVKEINARVSQVGTLLLLHPRVPFNVEVPLFLETDAFSSSLYDISSLTPESHVRDSKVTNLLYQSSH